jgi:hypothetical protein
VVDVEINEGASAYRIEAIGVGKWISVGFIQLETLHLPYPVIRMAARQKANEKLAAEP